MNNIEEYIYHFGLDHLEVYGTFKDENFFFEKDIKKISGYEIIVNKQVPKYHYKIIFKYEGDTVFAYYKGLRTQTIPTKDYVIVYSTGFKLILEEEIKFFLLQFNLGRVKRFDIAADILMNIRDTLGNFKELKQRGATYNGVQGEIETQYYGDTQKRNKRQIIRVYNKIREIQKNKKNKNYQGYLEQDCVTRIELEIRSELAKNRYYLYLFDVKIMLGIFKNYLSRHSDLFNDLPGNKITLFQKKDENIDPKNFQSSIYRDKRNKIFLGHAKSIFEMGYCPVRMLLGADLIHDDTKKFLDKDIVERIGEIERDIKTANYFKKQEIIANLSSNGKKNG